MFGRQIGRQREALRGYLRPVRSLVQTVRPLERPERRPRRQQEADGGLVGYRRAGRAARRRGCHRPAQAAPISSL